MDFYKLDHKEMDEKFLQGMPVSCQAVIREEDHLAGKLKEGSRLVVMLSNGKKYMGQVETFFSKTLNGFVEGELVIVRKF